MKGRPDFFCKFNEILRTSLSLRQTEVQAECRWVTKVVTTDPPKYIPHNLYSWEADLCAEEPVLGTLLIGEGRSVKYAKLGRSNAASGLTVRLSFWPFDWSHPGGVWVNLYQESPVFSSGIDVKCDSAVLSRDPKRLVEIMYEGEAIVQTGSILEVAKISLTDPVHLGLILIAKSDTEYSHWRWRLKRRFRSDLPSCLEFLRKGRCSGIVYL